MDRPNILLITTDQQRFDTLACAGNPYIWTPHLNWLCDNGIRFTNAYSDCPVCLPARTTLITGRHAFNHRVMSNRFLPGAVDERHTLPAVLTAAGYQTRLIGKSHHGPTPRHLMGFQHAEETADYFRFLQRWPELGRPSQSGVGGNEHVPAIDTVDETRSLTRWVVDRTMDFVETRDPSRPFFAWMSFEEPHPPLDPCRSYWELYANADVPEAVYGDWSADLAALPAPWQAVTWELSSTGRLSPQMLRQVRRAYYALVTQVDYHLGLLLGLLTQRKLLENTWIIFTSDHGEMLGDHHLGGKCVPFEGSAHVPLIIRPPAAQRDTRHPWRGTTCDTLACLADLLPTCCAMAGVPLPDAPLDGLDLLAAARGAADRQRLFGTCMYLHYLRAGRFKLCRETLTNTELLFDLAADPLERHNLLARGPAPAEAAGLRAALDAHLHDRDLLNAAAHDPGVAQDATHLPRNVQPGLRGPWGRA